ncbi:unnamed protein product [Sphagnum compactum]
MGLGDTIAWPDEPCGAPYPQSAHTLVSGRGAPFPWPATAPADGNACESKRWHFQGSFQKDRGIRTSTSSTQQLTIDSDAQLLTTVQLRRDGVQSSRQDVHDLITFQQQLSVFHMIFLFDQGPGDPTAQLFALVGMELPIQRTLGTKSQIGCSQPSLQSQITWH